MLRLLTDEQISPAVARQARNRCPDMSIVAMRSWRDGHFLSAADELILREAHEGTLTLVTFDRRTIPSLLRSWAEQGIDHGGVVLVDERTIAQNDIGGLVAALCALWKAEGDSDWNSRVVYLGRPA